ncbi:efflux RND transporter periplasmic adaptor subunit [Chitinophaga japonensis]|uniref:Multidrug efflux pump subunit AcrA (Membrane-fusion protein) n=1 Tax=Chitinophaga japonensis TaxID=104662 RepID=A0A562SPB9_CHIJA|nr:efflux RND transporter periplasmic adaptor subunit [Chitinophaga japonensis]TWI82530.1 multidrug efflux pump subunit AcrA (membrane-fusion protein) [Chitinophaga japonensis]
MKTLLHHTTFRGRLLTGAVLSGMLLSCRQETVVYPEKKEIIETVYASGKITAENEYSRFALCNGTILQKLVKDGDSVHKGQLLYVISNDAAKERAHAASNSYQVAAINLSGRSPLLNELRLALQNAEVKFRNDSLNYHRWKNLWSHDIGTRSNLDNAYSAYQVSLNEKERAVQQYQSLLNEMQVSHSNAQSQLAAARQDLQEYFIRSNCDGIVYQTLKEVGEAVHTSEAVALLGDHHRVIRLAIDQQDINKVKKGQLVLLQMDVTGTTIHEALITHIYPVMNEADQTFRADAAFKVPPVQPFIHSSIEANVIVQRKSNALVLPRKALVGADSLWIQHNGEKRKIGIRTGIATLENVEVLAGVKETTPVLLSPEAQ